MLAAIGVHRHDRQERWQEEQVAARGQDEDRRTVKPRTSWNAAATYNFIQVLSIIHVGVNTPVNTISVTWS